METKGTARTRANNKYNAKAYDRVALMVKKGKREEYRKRGIICLYQTHNKEQ